jgi:hypothetical protein
LPLSLLSFALFLLLLANDYGLWGDTQMCKSIVVFLLAALAAIPSWQSAS